MGSNSDNVYFRKSLLFFFSLMRGERIKVPLKAGHHRLASETLMRGWGGWGRVDSNTTKSEPSSARQRNAIKVTFRWRADDGPTLNASLVAL